MSEQVYQVPVSAHGAVFVRASSAEEAFEVANDTATPSDANLSMDVDPGYLERVEVVEDPRRDPINAPPEESTELELPEFPTVGDLRAARSALGLTQGEVAERMGVDPRTVSHYEQGTREIPLYRARDYARVLRREAMDDALRELET